MQVLQKVSEARNIPVHDKSAISAEDAYKATEVVTEEDLRHLDVDTLSHALSSAANLSELRASEAWRKLGGFVKLMLNVKMAQQLSEEAAVDCSKWLALFHASVAVLKLKHGATLDESIQLGEDDADGAVL